MSTRRSTAKSQPVMATAQQEPAPAGASDQAEVDRCRIDGCPHPPLQGGVCHRHFQEGRHVHQ